MTSAETEAVYLLVDAGANLTHRKFSRDLDSVIQRSKSSGISKMIVTGTTLQSSKEALRLSQLYPDFLYSTAGFHPHDAKSIDLDAFVALEEIVMDPACVAIGICGLDFNRNFSPPVSQIKVFEKQVELSCLWRKPLFVYEREAHSELVRILEKYISKLPPVFIHSFNGNQDEATKYLQMGFYIGLTGYIWKDKSEDGIRRMFTDKFVSLDRILVQSDSPFMYPNTRASKLPVRIKTALTERSRSFLERYCNFQRNEPCSLPVTVEMISASLKKNPQEIALATTYNALRIFGLNNAKPA